MSWMKNYRRLKPLNGFSTNQAANLACRSPPLRDLNFGELLFGDLIYQETLNNKIGGINHVTR